MSIAITKSYAVEKQDDEVLKGQTVGLDSKGQKFVADWSYMLRDDDAEDVLFLDLSVNGYEVSYNDPWVETEEEQGYVCTKYDPSTRQYRPVDGETAFFTEPDYFSLHSEVDLFATELVNRAQEAAQEAFDAVIDRAKESK